MSTLFVGLGTMGAPMARNLATSLDLVLFDPSPTTAQLAAELQVRSLPDLTTVPDDVDSVILMLPNSQVVESVLTGPDRLLEKLTTGALVVDMSSSVPASTRTLAELATARGVQYVDAPVSGGVAKARTGELAVMAGGTSEAVGRAAALIDAVAATVIHVGPSGSGHAAKALNNLLSAANIAAASEILVISTRLGIDPAVMVDVINASTGRSQATEVKFPQQVLTGAFSSGFALELMVKDLGIATDLADELGVRSPVVHAAAASTVSALRELPYSALDHTQVAQWYERINGVELRPHEGTTS
jgi:3-hydroxyisobutyrate dehydrogenase